MKGAITVLLLVFVAAAVFVFLIAVDSRYTLPGLTKPAPAPQERVQPESINSLLVQLRQVDNEITVLKEQQRAYEENLSSLQAHRQAIIDEINNWMKDIRDQVNDPAAREAVLQPSDVLVPKW